MSLQSLRNTYRSLREKWWFFLLKLPVYLGIGYLSLILLLSTALSRALVLEFLITLMPKTKLNGVNVLVMGIDNTKDVQRSDTIMVMHLDAEKNRIGVLSIPRDTRVNIPTVGLTKINHAYAYGGVPLLKRTVTEFLGIPVDYYIKVNLAGVQNLVDEMGGLDVNIPKNMYYVDQAGDLYIDLKKGTQHINGQQSVQFLRFRHDEGADLTRIQRQQVFIKSFANKVIDLTSDADLPVVVSKLSMAIETDMSNKEMAGLAVQFRDAIQASRVDTGTVPGSVTIISGISYWRPDIASMDQTISTVLMGLDTKRDLLVSKVETSDKSASQEARRSVTLKEVNRISKQSELAAKNKSTQHVLKTIKKGMVVEVLNGTGIHGEANRVAAHLKSMGVTVKRTANAGSFGYQKSMVVDWKGQVDATVSLAQALSIDPSGIIVYDRPTKSIDATIVVGKDWSKRIKGTQHN